jgi:hypothetical protein
MRLSLRLAGPLAIAGLLLSACGGAAPTGPSSPASSAPGTGASTSAGPGGTATTPAVTPAPNSPAAPGAFRYQPLYPFASLAEVQAWQASYASGGHQPWHLSASLTAQAFAAFLGFTGVSKVAGQSGTAADARVAVGYALPNGKTATAAIVHLVRWGSGKYVPWEVVGTDDTTLTLDIPGYGATVTSPVTIGGKLTGVDENLRAQARALGPAGLVGSYCCKPAGGQLSPWSLTLPLHAPSGTLLTIVVSTGGHTAAVERFAVTGVRVR